MPPAIGRRGRRRGSPGGSCSTAEIQRSMYIAASTIVIEASVPTSQNSRNAPSSTRNSDAKRPDPGTASVAMPVVMQIVASAGRPRASPPTRSNRSLPKRICTQPASRKSRAESRPWLIIWNVAPVPPWSLKTKMPSEIRLICADRRVGDDRRASRAGGTPRASTRAGPASESVSSTGWKSAAGPGKSGSAKRSMPYAPAFETTPESIAATSGGDSR